MKRMVRWLLNGLTVLSLLLCVATVVLWFVFGEQQVIWETRDPTAHHSFLSTTHYGVFLITTDGPLNYGGPHESFHPTAQGYVLNPRGILSTTRLRCTAYISAAILFIALPVFKSFSLIRARRRAERDASAVCLICGYDLRASPDRCPECGTAVLKKA